jgi:hypothetical protein
MAFYQTLHVTWYMVLSDHGTTMNYRITWHCAIVLFKMISTIVWELGSILSTRIIVFLW